MRTTLRSLAAATALMLPLQEAKAQLLTSEFGGTQATAFACEPGFLHCFTDGPQQVGTNGYNVQMRSGLVATSSGLGSVVGTGDYGLAANGTWNGAAGTYAGTDDNGLYFYGLRFMFDRPIYSVGAWMNYAQIGSGVAIIRALGANGELVAEYDLKTLAPISTPNQLNGQQFRGVTSGSAFYGFELAGSYLVTRDLFVSEDMPPQIQFRTDGGYGDEGGNEGGDIIFPSSLDQESPSIVTPEPGTYALVAGGMLALGFLKRRKRQK